jgi:hypothetical protein
MAKYQILRFSLKQDYSKYRRYLPSNYYYKTKSGIESLFISQLKLLSGNEELNVKYAGLKELTTSLSQYMISKTLKDQTIRIPSLPRINFAEAIKGLVKLKKYTVRKKGETPIEHFTIIKPLRFSKKAEFLCQKEKDLVEKHEIPWDKYDAVVKDVTKNGVAIDELESFRIVFKGLYDNLWEQNSKMNSFLSKRRHFIKDYLGLKKGAFKFKSEDLQLEIARRLRSKRWDETYKEIRLLRPQIFLAALQKLDPDVTYVTFGDEEFYRGTTEERYEQAKYSYDLYQSIADLTGGVIKLFVRERNQPPEAAAAAQDGSA